MWKHRNLKIQFCPDTEQRSVSDQEMPENARGLYLSTHSSNLSLIHAGFRDNVGKRSTSQELHDNLTHKHRHKDH